MFTCPHCPGSSRTFSSHGLKVHIGHKHKGQSASTPVPRDANILDVHDGHRAATPRQCRLASLVGLRGSIPVLRHIPKGARNQAAGKLSELIDGCVECNGVEDWFSLLSFAFTALRVPTKASSGNMTSKVKSNIESSGVWYKDELDTRMDGARPYSTRKVIESKVFDGDLRGAVRLLVSDDTFAKRSPDTLAALELKHPGPSRPFSSPQAPDTSYTTDSHTVDEVALVLGSFYNGSAAGLDGIRPGHLRELTCGSAGENGRRLMESLTRLTNFMLSGQVNVEVCPYLYGAALCAFKKKGGGLRPIAIGSVFRRLAAKLACRSVRDRMTKYLQPHQLGFGTRLGCEAAIHGTRTFVSDPTNAGCVILKLDVRNAFNTLERDVLLCEVRDKTPSLYPFLYQVYQCPSNLVYDDTIILSQVGAQQGDPLGPLVFSLAIHKIIAELKSTLNIWYLDDGTLGGEPEIVYQDLKRLLPRFKELGLEVNTAKCEFFPCSAEADSHFAQFSTLLPDLGVLSRDTFSLLGSPIFLEAVPDAIGSRRQLLITARERLQDVPAHVALALLQKCFAMPRINFLLRTSPTWLCTEEVSDFDDTLKSTVESILNVRLDEAQWKQAALPIRLGGIGVRCARDVGLPAFLASAHGVVGLVATILSSDGNEVRIPYASGAESAWVALSSGAPRPVGLTVQRAWDDVGARQVQKLLLDGASGPHLARLKAVSQPESGSWLHALPSPHLGTLLDDDSLRVAVALRLGAIVCEPHICVCGAMVDSDGHHALSCRRCSGRFPRHHALNDIVRRALVTANVPCILEPPGLSRSDGKRPDGLTLVPWKRGRCLIWDATCVSTVAASHIGRTVGGAAAAAEDAAAKKRVKYAALEPQYYFVPIAVETMGSWGSDAKRLIKEIGGRIAEKTGDFRSGSFLVQRMAIAIQRGNAASVLGTFAPETLKSGL